MTDPAETTPPPDTKEQAGAPEDQAAAEEARLAEEVLRGALAEIEAGNTDEARPELLKRLRKLPKAKIEDANGTYRVRLHGVEVLATSGWPQALADWCRKARRTIMAGGAV